MSLDSKAFGLRLIAMIYEVQVEARKHAEFHYVDRMLGHARSGIEDRLNDGERMWPEQGITPTKELQRKLADANERYEAHQNGVTDGINNARFRAPYGERSGDVNDDGGQAYLSGHMTGNRIWGLAASLEDSLMNEVYAMQALDLVVSSAVQDEQGRFVIAEDVITQAQEVVNERKANAGDEEQG